MTQDLGIQFHGADEQSGDVFVVETRASADMILQSHKHDHGHLSVLVSGRAEVTINGKAEIMTGYSMVVIPPNTIHEVRAITDIIWLCLWSNSVAPKDQAHDSLKLVGNYR